MKKYLILGLLFLNMSAVQAQGNNNLIKLELFSPFPGCIGVSYERILNNTVSADFEGGFIGVQLDDYFEREHFTGGYFSMGTRFYMLKYTDKNKEPQGLYLKPTVLTNYFQYVDTFTINDWNTPYTGAIAFGSELSVNFMVAFGSQWLLNERIAIDMWIGIGGGQTWEECEFKPHGSASYFGYEPYTPFKYSYTRLGRSPFMFDCGLSLGLLW